MRRFTACFFFILSVWRGIGAESPPEASFAEIIPARHWMYDVLSVLSLETGRATLAVNAPASFAEMRGYLDAVPYDRLSLPGQVMYRRAESFLGPSAALWRTGQGSIDIRPQVSVHARYRQSDIELPDYEVLERFNETTPFLSLPLTAGFSPCLSVFADYSVGEGFWSSGLSGNHANIPSTADSFDMNVPATAHASAGNGFFTAVVGRGALNAGRTLSGSMILSDSADRLDYASLVFFSRGIRISLTPVELAPDKFVYYHDISLQPFSFLTLRFSEAASVNSTIDLRYLNPAMIYHSYAGWKDDYGEAPGDESSPVGTQFAFSADMVPFKGLRLYGQFVMNQFQTRYELENFEGSATVIPNSLGGLAGVEFVHAVGEGFLYAGIEGVYTNPWLYILSNREISFYWSRKELVAPSGYTALPVMGWLGSPFGPDTVAVLAQVRYEVPFSYRAGLDYRFVCRGRTGTSFLSGSSDDYYPDSAAEANIGTPSGGTAIGNTINVNVSRSLSGRLEIGVKLGYSLFTGETRAQSIDTAATVTFALR